MDRTTFRKNDTAYHVVKYTLLSAAVGEGVTVALLLLFAFIVCKMTFPVFVFDGFVLLAASFGALAAGCLNGRFQKRKGIFVGVLSAGAILLFMLLCNVGFHADVSPWLLFCKVLLILLCAAFGGVIGVNHKSRCVY